MLALLKVLTIMADLKPFELETTLKIKTKSIEQTLLPLVQQVSLKIFHSHPVYS